MKRYLVFAYETYYPGGGWGDFVSAHDTIQEAISAANAAQWENTEIVDLETLKIIYPS